LFSRRQSATASVEPLYLFRGRVKLVISRLYGKHALMLFLAIAFFAMVNALGDMPITLLLIIKVLLVQTSLVNFPAASTRSNAFL
jgi:hypothetical protein